MVAVQSANLDISERWQNSPKGTTLKLGLLCPAPTLPTFSCNQRNRKGVTSWMERLFLGEGDRLTKLQSYTDASVGPKPNCYTCGF